MPRKYRRYKSTELLPAAVTNPISWVDFSQYATVEQTARFLGVSRCHVYKMLRMKNCQLEHIRTPLGTLVLLSSILTCRRERQKAADEKYAAYKARQAECDST